MSLIKWSPFFEPFGNADAFFDGVGLPAMARTPGLVPAIDVYDQRDAVVVETVLPGVDKKNIEISIEHDVLTLKGSSERKTEVDENEYYRKEIRSGSFMRQIVLPGQVHAEAAIAEFKDGILKVTIPKIEAPKAKTITIDIKN